MIPIGDGWSKLETCISSKLSVVVLSKFQANKQIRIVLGRVPGRSKDILSLFDPSGV